MKRIVNELSKYILPILILLCLTACRENEKCAKYANENYLEETVDTAMITEVLELRGLLSEKFGAKSVHGLEDEAYLLYFYSSHGFGKSVKFEKQVGKFFISVKCENLKDWYEDCREYRIEITEDEWSRFEKMIYEFDFWTAEGFRGNKDVLDGFCFLLEGNRPQARDCEKKAYKLTARGSPEYDKIGDLCSHILEYEDKIMFSYEQAGKINQ